MCRGYTPKGLIGAEKLNDFICYIFALLLSHTMVNWVSLDLGQIFEGKKAPMDIFYCLLTKVFRNILD